MQIKNKQNFKNYTTKKPKKQTKKIANKNTHTKKNKQKKHTKKKSFPFVFFRKKNIKKAKENKKKKKTKK